MAKRSSRRKPADRPGRPSSGARPSERDREARRSWFRKNWRDIRFLLVFISTMALYYVLTLLPPVKDGFFPAYLRVNAVASGWMLNAMGFDVTVDDKSLIAGDGSAIEIERGCDAVEPSALFVAAVIASPVALSARLRAAAIGTLLLLILNLIRVASLFLIRIYYPRAFDVMHLDVWQAVFIFVAILLWAYWASRMARGKAVTARAGTAANR